MAHILLSYWNGFIGNDEKYRLQHYLHLDKMFGLRSKITYGDTSGNKLNSFCESVRELKKFVKLAKCR